MILLVCCMSASNVMYQLNCSSFPVFEGHYYFGAGVSIMYFVAFQTWK